MRIFFCLAPLLVACSSVAVVEADAGSGVDAGDQGDADIADVTPPKVTKVGDRCTGSTPCSTGQACVGISPTGDNICLYTCLNGMCRGGEECVGGACYPTCGEGCPPAMTCNGAYTTSSCRFICSTVASLCGPTETCDPTNGCVKVVPDAGPKACMPGGGTATSGIPGTKTVGTLTTGEQETFCDWAAGVTGGYDCHGACDGGLTVQFSATRADCIAKFTKTGCAATVSEAEACMKANAQDVCALRFITSPACATLRACP